jgi:hypothetical protein
MNDTLIAGATSAFYVPTMAAFYSVVAIPATGCSEKSHPFFWVPLSVFFPEHNLTIDVFPNPVNKTLKISSSSSIHQPVAITMFDMLGRVVISIPSSTKLPEEIDVLLLPSGVYVFSLTIRRSPENIRIVKQD